MPKAANLLPVIIRGNSLNPIRKREVPKHVPELPVSLLRNLVDPFDESIVFRENPFAFGNRLGLQVAGDLDQKRQFVGPVIVEAGTAGAYARQYLVAHRGKIVRQRLAGPGPQRTCCALVRAFMFEGKSSRAQSISAMSCCAAGDAGCICPFSFVMKSLSL